jgi:UDP-2,4-diacetamido-2,4,6-trideoxy-beta-L-altropyranose hydrolase
MAAGNLMIRADAGIAMGTGHVMRCIALAQAWQDRGGQCIFVMAETTAATEERVRAENFEVVRISAPPGSAQDAALLVGLALARQASWMVVDGYQFDVEYQRKLKASGVKLLVVDDTGHAGAYVADLVLDQNAQAAEDFYRQREPCTRLLLGARYAMLRREFKPWREWKRETSPRVRKVLVTVGGSDPDNLALTIMQAIRLLAEENLEATVVMGGSNPHGEVLEREIRHTGGKIRLVQNASNMPELMAGADVAVSAAGSTCLEMCLLSLPAVIIDVAENQRPAAQELNRLGIAIHAGSVGDVAAESIASQMKPLLASAERRAEMSRRSRELVDGLGADRVVSAMQGANLVLRRAEEKDCLLLWEWANEPDVRSASFSSEPIAWPAHRDWFTKKLGDERILIFIASDEHGVPVGQVRFETTNREADIDISISPEKRGLGLGAPLIEKAVQAAFEQTDLIRVHGFVKAGNRASAQAFERANFRYVGAKQVNGSAAVHYERDRGGR